MHIHKCKNSSSKPEAGKEAREEDDQPKETVQVAYKLQN